MQRYNYFPWCANQFCGFSLSAGMAFFTDGRHQTVAMVEEIEIPSFRHFQVDDNGGTDNQEQQTHFFELLIGMENTDAYNRENDSY